MTNFDREREGPGTALIHREGVSHLYDSFAYRCRLPRGRQTAKQKRQTRKEIKLNSGEQTRARERLTERLLRLVQVLSGGVFGPPPIMRKTS